MVLLPLFVTMLSSTMENLIQRIKNKDNPAITVGQEENRGPEFICKSALEVDFS